MNENRLPDYLEHIQQAAIDARSFVDGLAKEDFLADKRTQQAVIMSLIIIGEAATKIMDGYTAFTQAHSEVPWRSMRNMRNRMELLSNVVYGVGQAAFLSDSSSTWTPSLNFTLFTTNVSSTNPLSRFHFFCAASSSL